MAIQNKVVAYMNNYFRIVLASMFLAILVLFSLVMGLSLGAIDISLLDTLSFVFNHSSNDAHYMERIVWELRFPRVILAFIAGCGLAISGFVLQTVTRNPLADPYLFGISSGASFGVVLVITLLGSVSSISMSTAAFIGSLVSMFLLIAIAGRRASQQVESMLLAGVALSFLFSSFTSLLLYHSDPQAIASILFWTLGSFSRAQWATLWFPTLIILISSLLLILYRRPLNAMLLGDESAATLGIRVKPFRLLMLIMSSLITATIVAMCGGIGFVGLMVPHIVRFFISQGSLWGMALTTISGGIFMIWVDIISRTLLENQELPVGVITAATGSLFFLGLLYFRKSNRG